MAKSEALEQTNVVRRLKYARLLFCAIPNGLETTVAATRTMHAEGLVPGAPDLLIFTPPPNRPDVRGVALEMKRENAKDSDWRANQREWARALEQDCGWIYLLGKGCDDAVAKLRALGYEL